MMLLAEPSGRGQPLSRIGTSILAGCLSVLSMGAGSNAHSAEKASVPNIVLILADDKD